MNPMYFYLTPKMLYFKTIENIMIKLPQVIQRISVNNSLYMLDSSKLQIQVLLYHEYWCRQQYSFRKMNIGTNNKIMFFSIVVNITGKFNQSLNLIWCLSLSSYKWCCWIPAVLPLSSQCRNYILSTLSILPHCQVLPPAPANHRQYLE